MITGRPKKVYDLENYCCPKCKQQPVEKSKFKNTCVQCYRQYCNDRVKAAYYRNRGTEPKKPGAVPCSGWDVKASNMMLRVALIFPGLDGPHSG
jgi:hypothetical protein